MVETFDTIAHFFINAPLYLELLILIVGLAAIIAAIMVMTIKYKQQLISVFTFFKKSNAIVPEIIKSEGTQESEVKDEYVNEMTNHKLFSYLLNFELMHCSRLDFKDMGKNEILAKTLFPLYAETFNKNFIQFVKEVNLKKSSNAIKIEMIKCIYDSRAETDNKFIEDATANNDRDVANFVLAKFNTVNNLNIEEAITLIEYIFDGSDGYDNKDKIHSALYLLIVPFERLGSSAIKMFKKMNGDLKGKSFKNMRFNGTH